MNENCKINEIIEIERQIGFPCSFKNPLVSFLATECARIATSVTLDSLPFSFLVDQVYIDWGDCGPDGEFVLMCGSVGCHGWQDGCGNGCMGETEVVVCGVCSRAQDIQRYDGVDLEEVNQFVRLFC